MAEGEVKSKNLIGMILLEANIINEKDLRKALEEQKKLNIRLGEALIKIGVATKEDIKWALAIQQGLPFVRLKDQYIDPEAVRMVPKEIADKYKILPFLKFEDGLTVVVSNPLSEKQVGELEQVLGTKIKLCLGMEEDVERTLAELYAKSEIQQLSYMFETHIFDPNTYEEVQHDRSGYTLLLKLLERAAKEGVESVHFEPDVKDVLVKFKDEKGYQVMAKLAQNWYPVVLGKLLSIAESVRQTGLVRAGLLRIQVNDRTESFYVSTTQTTLGEAVTMVRLGRKLFPKKFDEIQAPKDDLEAIKNILQIKERLSIFYGSNRADKLSLILPLLEGAGYLERRLVYLGERGDLVQAPALVVEPKRGELSDALFAAASQKPDLLITGFFEFGGLVSEILSFVSRGTSVLALTQLENLEEVFDFLVETVESKTLLQRYLGSMFRVIAYRAFCPFCRKKRSITKAEAYELRLKGISAVYEEAGCPACGFSGFNGIRFLFEYITREMSAEIASAYSRKRDFKKILAKLEFVSLRSRLEKLLADGELSISEFRRVLGG